MSNQSKLLSFCFAGKNDNYGGKFVQRLANSINYLARNADALGRLEEVEVVVADWGSTTPLSEVLPLSEQGANITRFLHVPAEIAKNDSHKETAFHGAKAINVALRRASGNYISCGPADILITEYSLSQLIKLISGELPTFFNAELSCMGIRRKFIPNTFDDDDITHNFRRLERFIELADVHQTAISFPGLFSGYGAFLFTQEMILNMKGTNESYNGWGGTDIELGLMFNGYYPLVDLSSLDIYVYDFQHEISQFQRRERTINIIAEVKPEINDDNWGLNNVELPEAQVQFKKDQKPDSTSPAIQIQSNYENKYSSNAHSEDWLQLLNSKFYQECFFGLPPFLPEIKSYHYPLAWFAKTQKCFKYFEFEGGKGFGATVMSHINPSAELYITLPPSATNPENSDMIFPQKASKMLSNSHKGHIWFIPGKPQTAFDRIKNSFIGNMYFDLVVIDIDLFADQKRTAIIDQAFSYLSKGGSIIIHSNQSSQLKDIKEHVNNISNYQQHYSDKLGIMFLYSPELTSISNHNSSQINRAWSPVKRRKLAYILSHLFENLGNLFQQLLFIKYYKWILHSFQFFRQRYFNKLLRLKYISKMNL